jgi:HlyD family secretion protein
MWRVTRVLVPLGAVVVAVAYAYGETDAPPDYITAPVERGTIATLVQATGTVDAQITVDVSSQLSGRMADVFVNFNDLVKAGQPLAGSRNLCGSRQ